ncbi:hypothetical protein L9F63_011396, partial [Diploptera punctata]
QYKKFALLILFLSPRDTLLAVWLLYRVLTSCSGWDDHRPIMMPRENYVLGEDRKVYPYDRYMPLIFIGGVPRSGTTLMRAMLDAHPEVRWSGAKETRVIPRLLQMQSHWGQSPKENVKKSKAGISVGDVTHETAVLSIITHPSHNNPNQALCTKDPLTFKSAAYLSELFPQSKFIFMLRDGRATVHSIISRKVTITGFDLTSYRQCMIKWNSAIQAMYNQCREVGSSRCFMVYYEQLVLHPAEWMRRILDFLDIPWNESVLHHEELINKPGGVSLS